MRNKITAMLLILGMLILTIYTFNTIAGVDQDPFSIEIDDE